MKSLEQARCLADERQDRSSCVLAFRQQEARHQLMRAHKEWRQGMTNRTYAVCQQPLKAGRYSLSSRSLPEQCTDAFQALPSWLKLQPGREVRKRTALLLLNDFPPGNALGHAGWRQIMLEAGVVRLAADDIGLGVGHDDRGPARQRIA